MFEHLRRSDPLALNEFVSTKLRIVSGEITEERFGLTPQDFHQLATEVDLIILPAEEPLPAVDVVDAVS